MPFSKPPLLRGLPLLGNLLEYRSDHVAIFKRGHETLGPIFSLRLGPQRAVVLVGPACHRFFFTEVDRILSIPEVYRFVIPMFGKVLNAAELETRKYHLGILRRAFQGKKLHTYVALMVREVTAWLDTLGEDGEIELWEAFQALSMNIAASSLMGPEIRRRIDEFIPLYNDLANGMEFVLPPNLPLPRFRRRDRARQELFALIRPLIAKRQARPERYRDFLTTLAVEAVESGDRLNGETIVGLGLLTLFTAYISTAAQTSWALIHLLQHPTYRYLIRQEQDAALPVDPQDITVETLHDLKYLGWAIKETERLRPVFSHYARHNAQAYELGGYHVPEGWLTMVCPAVSHRLPTVFPRPNQYDPLRFAPGREEDKTPFSLIGFGGGFYRCPGAHFGTSEMKVILSLLLQRYQLERVDPGRPSPNYDIGIIRPQPPCRVRYRRRNQEQLPDSGMAVLAHNEMNMNGE